MALAIIGALILAVVVVGVLLGREIGKDGSIVYEIERSVPDSLLVTRIADRSLPFGGTWTHTLFPKGVQ